MSDHPSQKLSPEKSAALYAVASREFANYGFNQASLNRIISEIGMSKSSFYHYFAGKRDLFNQTIDQAISPILAGYNDFDLSTLTAETLWPSLFQLAGELIEQINASTDLTIIMRMFYRCIDNPQEKDLIAPYMGRFTDWLTALLHRGQELDLFRDDLPDSLLIDALMAMGISIDRWMLDNWEQTSASERVELNQKTIALFIQVLTPPGEPA